MASVYFQQETIVIIGAVGGLGRAFAEAFAQDGAHVVLVARQEAPLMALSAQIPLSTPFVADLTDRDALHKLTEQLIGKNVRAVINAIGVDVRKKLADHTPSDISRTLSVNLEGAILLTQAFLPLFEAQGHGQLIHVTGFTDGRLAFPYYSVDVASRAGVVAFLESLTREIENPRIRVGYFSPSPTDTEAERPFHALWKQMGVAIVPLDKVTEALVNMVKRGQRNTIMGGVIPQVFAKMNALAPRLADAIAMRSMGKQLKAFLYPTASASAPKKKNTNVTKMGIGLMVLSFVLYGVGLFVMPLLPLALATKAILVPVTLVIGEASFWIGGALVGKEIVARFRHYLNPCNWCQPVSDR